MQIFLIFRVYITTTALYRVTDWKFVLSPCDQETKINWLLEENFWDWIIWRKYHCLQQYHCLQVPR